MLDDYNISETIWKYLQSQFEDLSNAPFSNDILNKQNDK